MQTEIKYPSDKQINSNIVRSQSRFSGTDNISVRLTGSIVDQDIAEALEEAYQKHGNNLPTLLRNL